MAKATLPPETCEECGKEIKGTARANVFDNRIVCTPCWNRLDVERQWHGPATDRQVAYARDLGLHFPADITKLEMADLLTRNLEYEDEPAAPHSMLERAASLGVRNVTRYAGRNSFTIVSLSICAILMTGCLPRGSSRMSRAKWERGLAQQRPRLFKESRESWREFRK